MREDDGQAWPTDSSTENCVDTGMKPSHTYTHSHTRTHTYRHTRKLTASTHQSFVVLASDDDLTT